jgi:hypothetical protein
MLKQIVEHPQFWALVGIAWGITSDVLGSSKTIKANGVSQLLFGLVTRAISDKASRR